MTVKQLKDKLNDWLAQLDRYSDNAELDTVSNTYFLGHPRYFLGIASEGYINLDHIEAKLEEADMESMLDIMTVIRLEAPEQYGILIDELYGIAIEDGVTEYGLEMLNDAASAFDFLDALTDVLTDEGWDKVAAAIYKAWNDYEE